MKWQTIMTAPRDGTSILVHGNNAPGLPGGKMLECDQTNTAVAAWWGNDGNDDEDGAWIIYTSQPSEPEVHFEPTHWMPLPDTPTGGTE